VAYVVRFLNWLGPTMLLPVMPLFITTLDVSQGRVSTFTGLIVGVSSATGTLAALVLGPLGDRLGHRRVLVGTTLAAALLAFPQALVTSGWQLLALQALQGAATGAMGPALSALLARSTTADDTGAVFGLDSSVTAGARAVAPLLGAAAVLWLGQRGVFGVMGVVLLASAVLAVVGLPAQSVGDEAPAKPVELKG
jgi:DHA1 family multidrug resistance protein-like MFS transporter